MNVWMGSQSSGKLSTAANIPRRRLINPRRSHCDRACKSNTSSSKFKADVNAGYSDEC